MKEHPTILITGCGGHFIRDTIRCYRSNGEINIRIIGVASRLDEVIRIELDKYIEVPTSTDPSYLEVILNICKEESVDIVIPNVDEEITLFCENVDRFSEIGTILSAPSYEAAIVATNKIEFLRFLEREGIPHPRFGIFNTPDEFAEESNMLGFPEKAVCVKLSNRAGSVGFRIIDANIDLFDLFMNSKPTSRYISKSAFSEMMLNHSGDLPAMIVQEYLPGAEYSVDLLADHGKILYIAGRENTVCENSIPMESVLSCNDEAYSICERIVRGICLDGNIGIDFIFNENGEPIPIEVNARITSTISLCAAGGLNLAYLQVKRLLGYMLPDIQPEYGVRMKRLREPVYSTKGGETWKM